MEGVVGMEGTNVLIIFDDGISASKKEGKITKITAFSITLDDKHMIPKHRIIRVEIKE